MAYDPENISDSTVDWTRLKAQLQRMEDQISQNARDIDDLAKGKMGGELAGDVGSRTLYASQRDQTGDGSKYSLIASPTYIMYRKTLEGEHTTEWQFYPSDIVKNVLISTKMYENVKDGTQITAPVVASYEFLCWVGCAPYGWKGAAYFNDYGSSSPYIYIASGTGGNIRCTALYKRR